MAAHKKDRALSIFKGRSMCPCCRHSLAWYDLVPVISWVLLKGRCRYCKKPISPQYPLVECITALFIVLSFWQWPYVFTTTASYGHFVVWTFMVTVMMILALYDLYWRELPTKLIYTLAGLSLIFIAMEHLLHDTYLLANGAGAVLVGGFFWLLYQVSGGKWIGGGDVRYGFVMGLLLGGFKGLLGLGIASYAGVLYAAGLVVAGKYHKKMQIPFGPFLILGTYTSLLWGHHVIDWYKQIAGL